MDILTIVASSVVVGATLAAATVDYLHRRRAEQLEVQAVAPVVQLRTPRPVDWHRRLDWYS